jgi:thioredoxin-related protein
VYVFTPTCPWCLKNKQQILNLAAAQNARYDFVGLSLTSQGLSQYLASSPYNFPVYVVNTNALPENLKLNSTPDTLIFSQDGKLEQVFDGYYNAATAAGVASFFGMRIK